MCESFLTATRPRPCLRLGVDARARPEHLKSHEELMGPRMCEEDTPGGPESSQALQGQPLSSRSPDSSSIFQLCMAQNPVRKDTSSSWNQMSEAHGKWNRLHCLQGCMFVCCASIRKPPD